MQDESVLCQCGENKQEAGEDPDVNCFEVRHLGSQGSYTEPWTNELRRRVGWKNMLPVEHRGEGEDGRDAENHPAGDNIAGNEEGEPGNDDEDD